MFNFDIKKTAIFRSLKIWRFPLFRYASAISWIFICFFAISLLLIGFSFFDVVSQFTALKIAVFSLFCFIVSLEIASFANLKIKNPMAPDSLVDAISNPEKYNMAEF